MEYTISEPLLTTQSWNSGWRHVSIALPLDVIVKIAHNVDGKDILAAFFQSHVLPKRFGGVATGFTSSGSIYCDLHERHPKLRAPLARRLHVTLFHHWVIVHVLFVLACFIGIGLAFTRTFTHRIPSVYKAYPPQSRLDQAIYLIVRIGWPPLLWLQCVSSALSPIFYVLCPPTAPERETLLDRSPTDGVAYPKLDARRPRSVWVSWRYARPGISVVYTVLLLVASSCLRI